MNIKKIRIGSVLRFEEGIFIAEEINDGNLIYGILYIYGEDGYIKHIDFPQLTYSDIERRLYEYDGHNHKVRWEGARS